MSDIQKTLDTRQVVRDDRKKAEDLLTSLATDAVMELDAAIAKHPLFPKQLMDKYMRRTMLDKLEKERHFCDNPKFVTAYNVFMEEYYEFIEAVYQGNSKLALKELKQCIAMLLRTALHLEHYLATQEKDS